MIKLVKQRNEQETNLLPVLAMFLNTSTADMLSAAGFPADYNPDKAEARWAMAKKIAQENRLQWFLDGLETCIRMPANRLTIPGDGSGILFCWNYTLNGGLCDDGTIKSVELAAFDSGFVFDPYLDYPISVLSYQQALEDLGGKIVKIICRGGPAS